MVLMECAVRWLTDAPGCVVCDWVARGCALLGKRVAGRGVVKLLERTALLCVV